jgi:hypothetical protein
LPEIRQRFGKDMNAKKKNILTALALLAVAVTIYVFAVMQAMSQ